MSAKKMLKNSTTDKVFKKLRDKLVTDKIPEGRSEDPQIFMAWNKSCMQKFTNTQLQKGYNSLN